MATPLPLEGDGLIENLFYFLWCKDDFGAGPRIYIPHTVLYKFAQPSAWYFTSVKTGKIKKKAKVNLNNVQIEHEFTKKRSASDIVAYYIYFASASRSSSAGAGNGAAAAATTIEYFDADALRDFLYKREKTQNGMLQKFVLPKGTSNATVRAIWSPKICLLERRVNVRNVHDKRYSIYERGVTFDGADVHSRPEPVRGAMLPGEVQLLCEQIVDHVTQVSYHKYRIARMVLHLKCDADDKLWLLWCSSLRLLNVNASEAAPMRPLDIVNDAQVPEFAMQLLRQSSAATVGIAPSVSSSGISTSGDVDEKRMGFTRCTSCGRQVEQKKLLATTYKAVLDHFQRFLRFLRRQVNESEHAAIEWPPDERLVQAAGGVGFGILYTAGKSGSSSVKRASQASISSSGGNAACGGAGGALTRKELIIPPVIQFLHPAFSVDDFERHRHDPLFLHKPVGVCESCCLVYSDYTTSSLEVNSIRPTAPAILRPHCELSDAKKRLDPLDPLAAALANSNNNSASGGLASSPGARKSARRTKPPASAWKPVTSDAKAATLSKVRGTGPRSTLSTWPSAPQLPQRIDSFDDVHIANFADLPLASGNGAGLSSSQSAHALQHREEAFFRELNQQRDLERGHPLHHMLESATRLASTKKQQQLAALRLSATNAAHAFGSSSGGLGKSRSIGALPELLEQQLAGKKVATKSPYSVVLRLRESTATALDASDGGEHGAPELQLNQRSPSKQAVGKTAKKRAGARGGKKKRVAKSKAARDSDDCSEGGGDDDDDEASDAHTQQRRQMRFVSEREKKASEEHQDFLFAALSQAQAQLEHMESLASLLPDLDEPPSAPTPLHQEHDGGVEQHSDCEDGNAAGGDQEEGPLDDPDQQDAGAFVVDQDAGRPDLDHLEPHRISDPGGEDDRDDSSRGENDFTNAADGEEEPAVLDDTDRQDVDASVDQAAPSIDRDDAGADGFSVAPFTAELDIEDRDTDTTATGNNSGGDDVELHDAAHQIRDGNVDEVAQSILLDAERALLGADPSSNEHDLDDGSDDHDRDSNRGVDGEHAHFDNVERPHGVDDSADPVAPCPENEWREDESALAVAHGDAQGQALGEDTDERPYPT